MKINKPNLKPAIEWTKTVVIVLAIGFAGGYWFASTQATHNQAQVQNAIKAVAPIAQAASKAQSR